MACHNDAETVERMRGPKPGYRFTEENGLFVHVVKVSEPGGVLIETYVGADCKTPSMQWFPRVEEFQQYYKYLSKVGYWIKYLDDKASCEHYKERMEAAVDAAIDKLRTNKT